MENGACASVNAKGDAGTGSSLYSDCIPDPIGVRKFDARRDARILILRGRARPRKAQQGGAGAS